MSKRWIHGTFEDEHRLLAATSAVREQGYEVEDVFTPYPVHGLPEAMGLEPSRLGVVCFVMGAVGCALALAFQYWTSATDWPINVGGKPFDSLPAFVPIAFEITILFAGLGVVVALFLRCRLGPGASSFQPDPRVTDDRFVLVVRLEGATHTAAECQRLLEAYGAVRTEDRLEELITWPR
ncbi:MAG: DUF3341 domain-containing protein [Planctomycetota bacterium]